MNTLEIYNLCYGMELGAGGDIWRLQGDCPNHPFVKGRIQPSTPINFNEENLTFTTASGRHYKIMSFAGNKLMSFAGNKQEIIDQIKKDIENKGYEVH